MVDMHVTVAVRSQVGLYQGGQKCSIARYVAKILLQQAWLTNVRFSCPMQSVAQLPRYGGYFRNRKISDEKLVEIVRETLI